jgi:hypothetical protein
MMLNASAVALEQCGQQTDHVYQESSEIGALMENMECPQHEAMLNGLVPGFVTKRASPEHQSNQIAAAASAASP